MSISIETIDENVGTAYVVFTLDSATSETVTINWSTVNDTAIAGSDFGQLADTASVTGTVVFLPNIILQQAAISILDDSDSEGPEAFRVTIDSITNAQSGTDGSIYIQDNDGTGTGTGIGTGTGTGTGTGINVSPDVSDPADVTSAEGETVNFGITASDVDGTILSYQITSGNTPNGITFDTTTGIFSGTLDYTSSGTYSISVGVQDDDGAVDIDAEIETFTWTVSNTVRLKQIDVTYGVLAARTNVTALEMTQGDTPVLDVVTNDGTILPSDLFTWSAPGLTLTDGPYASIGLTQFPTAGPVRGTLTVTVSAPLTGDPPLTVDIKVIPYPTGISNTIMDSPPKTYWDEAQFGTRFSHQLTASPGANGSDLWRVSTAPSLNEQPPGLNKLRIHEVLTFQFNDDNSVEMLTVAPPPDGESTPDFFIWPNGRMAADRVTTDIGNITISPYLPSSENGYQLNLPVGFNRSQNLEWKSLAADSPNNGWNTFAANISHSRTLSQSGNGFLFTTECNGVSFQQVYITDPLPLTTVTSKTEIPSFGIEPADVFIWGTRTISEATATLGPTSFVANLWDDDPIFDDLLGTQTLVLNLPNCPPGSFPALYIASFQLGSIGYQVAGSGEAEAEVFFSLVGSSEVSPVVAINVEHPDGDELM